METASRKTQSYLVTDLKPLNIGLSWTKKATIRENWRSVVNTVTLIKSIPRGREEEEKQVVLTINSLVVQSTLFTVRGLGRVTIRGYLFCVPYPDYHCYSFKKYVSEKYRKIFNARN